MKSVHSAREETTHGGADAIYRTILDAPGAFVYGRYQKNLADGWDKVWADELTAHFPRDTRRVLDIGTGPGFLP